MAFSAFLLETGPVSQLRSLHINQINCLQWLFESSFVTPGRRFFFQNVNYFWVLRKPECSLCHEMQVSWNQMLAIIKEISGREIYVFNIYTMAVFWLQTCSFRKFIWLSFSQNGSSNTLQILVKLFFTASQMGDRNQIKQFVQFLASCMLEIKIMPGCT